MIKFLSKIFTSYSFNRHPEARAEGSVFLSNCAAYFFAQEEETYGNTKHKKSQIENCGRLNTTSSGFTILEIIISLFILIIMFSVAQANYRGFITEKNLDTARDRIISDIRLAQQHAQAGKMPSGCLTPLDGYRFITSSASYEIQADCAADVSVKTVQLSSFSSGLSLTSGQVIYFRTLGKGPVFPPFFPDTLTLTLTQQSGGTKTITVSVGGEIR